MTTGSWAETKANLTKDIDNEGAQCLLNHWSDLYEKHERIPRRRELDPLAFFKHSPHIWIVDLLENNEFKFRLVGDHIAEYFGFNPVNKAMENVFQEPQLSHVLEFYETIISTKSMVLHHGQRHIPHQSYPIEYERLAMPLANDDGELVHIVGATFFYGFEGQENRSEGGKNVFTHNEYYPIG